MNQKQRGWVKGETVIALACPAPLPFPLTWRGLSLWGSGPPEPAANLLLSHPRFPLLNPPKLLFPLPQPVLQRSNLPLQAHAHETCGLNCLLPGRDNVWLGEGGAPARQAAADC